MSRWKLAPLNKERSEKGEDRVWLVRQADGSTVAHPAGVSSGPRRGPGAVKKARERREQLERELAKQRRERLERAAAAGGGFEPRSSNGQRVERLTDVKPSTPAESAEAVIAERPVRRSKQLPAEGERTTYAKAVVVDGGSP